MNEHDALRLVERMRAAFSAQMTNDLTDEVLAYAARRARWIERQTGRSDPGLPRELLDDAIGDTYMGTVTWDPTIVLLSVHLKSVIRSRISTELARGERFPHVSIDGRLENFESEVSEALAQARPGAGPAETQTCVDIVVAALRELAGDDAALERLIDAYADESTERRDVMRATGMTAHEYHNAYRRMLRLVERLSTDVRAAAITAMG